MAESQRHLKIWYDPEGDYLEVIFDQKQADIQNVRSL